MAKRKSQPTAPQPEEVLPAAAAELEPLPLPEPLPESDPAPEPDTSGGESLEVSPAPTPQPQPGPPAIGATDRVWVRCVVRSAVLGGRMMTQGETRQEAYGIYRVARNNNPNAFLVRYPGQDAYIKEEA